MLLHTENILHQHYIFTFSLFLLGVHKIKDIFEYIIKVVTKWNEGKYVLYDFNLKIHSNNMM